MTQPHRPTAPPPTALIPSAAIVLPERAAALTRRALDFDDNTAPWQEGAPEVEPGPPLTENIDADVVIIGGGFTGMSAAWHLSQRHPTLRIVLLEARRVANGASGRNGGQMLNWVNGVDTADEALTQRVFALTRGGIDDIVNLIRDQGLRVRHARDGALEVQRSAEGAEHAHEKAERLARWGIPLRFIQGAELSATLSMTGARGALLDPTAGQLNGVDYLRELQRLLVARGVQICEDSPVLTIEEGATHRVVTAAGAVRARALVLGTGGYTHRLGYFRMGVFPLHSHALATAPLTAAEREELGWRATSAFCDDLDRISYGCLTVDGRVVFGGGSNAAYDYGYGGPTAWRHDRTAAFQAIQDRLFHYFPRLRTVGVTHRWTGTLSITLSRMCSIGVRGAHQNVYFGLGFSGHGVTLGNLAGRIIADLYDGEGERYAGLPFVNKALGGIPPDPFRWVGYHAYTRLTGRSPRRST